MSSRTGRLEDGDAKFPILSASDRGARMTQLMPGQPVGQLTGALLVRVLLCLGGWAVAFSPICAAYLGLEPSSIGSPWAAGISLVVAYVVLSLTLGLAERSRRAFGQARVAGLLTVAVTTGGFVVTAFGWLMVGYSTDPQPAFDLHNIATSTTLPRELLAVVGAAVALWAVVTWGRLGPALAHARSRQQTIERLRRSGTRHAGELSELDFRRSWLFDQPIFRILVTYSAAGEARVVQVHMRTTQDRVPVVGSPMVVLTDESGQVHVDLDRSADIEFAADDGRYAPSEG